MSVSKKQPVLQFRVILLGIEPAIWRRIQVPRTYTFWDLHVAIQDSMGWLDQHLHAFRRPEPEPDSESAPEIQIGIPEEDIPDEERICLPGWHVLLARYFVEKNDSMLYEYDFGDGWEHAVVFEGTVAAATKTVYPICLGGERACPPEDCGGICGYEGLLQILQDPTHEEHEETLEWLGRPFDPEAFDPQKVKFDNPRARWKASFSEEEARHSSPSRA